MAYLAHVGWKPAAAAARATGAYPFSVPAVRTLDGLDLDVPVTFLVGENGSGKSTVLEALAIACELPSVGEADPGDDRTLSGPRAPWPSPSALRIPKLVAARRSTQGGPWP